MMPFILSPKTLPATQTACYQTPTKNAPDIFCQRRFRVRRMQDGKDDGEGVYFS